MSRSRIIKRCVSCGPKGTFNRTPYIDPTLLQPEPGSTGGGASALTITDPLQIYRDYINRGILKQDISQYILAKQLQKLQLKLLNYKPNLEKTYKINELIRKLDSHYLNQDRDYYNSKLFTNFIPDSLSNSTILKNVWWDGMYLGKLIQINRTNKELIKILNTEEELEEIESPKGLIINGEVGCGKSMLLDIFASSLPIDGKLRIHYNNLILWIFNEIHEINKRRAEHDGIIINRHSFLQAENELMMFEISRKLINKCHVLMLDEFMMPDLASGKLVKMFLNFYFKLGGVLVATSNRLPDDLYDTSFNKNQFELFEKLLKIKCDVHEMNSTVDYRMSYKEKVDGDENVVPYLIVDRGDGKETKKQFDELIQTIVDSTKFTKTEFESYGRTLEIKKHYDGIVKFEFSDLCSGCKFGSSDFISLAARYHTIIIDNVPILTIRQKNEARKFINLIDALYESRCKLILRTAVKPESLFFPERKFTNTSNTSSGDDNNLENQNEEMYSKTSIDLQNPYRPNITSYDEGKKNYEHVELKTNFKDIAKFTGQDEMFAFKRAVSRIHEMCHSENWRLDGRWIPNDESMRPWEQSSKKERVTVPGVAEVVEPVEPAEEEKVVRDKYLDTIVHAQYQQAPVFKKYRFWALGKWFNKQKRVTDEIAQKWMSG